MSKALRFTSWSASRLDDYTLCPFMAMHKHLLKTCPTCFKGRLVGKYGTIQKCDKCGKPKPIPPAFARGGEIGETLEKFVNGAAKKLHAEITHPKIIEKAKALRAGFKKGLVKVERMLNFDRSFRLLPEGWSPEIWLIVKMDVEVDPGGGLGEVLDWKTGGVDKHGQIRANEKYDDQLLAYKVAKLCADPTLTRVNAALGFVDAADDTNPFVEREPLSAKDLPRAKKHLQKLSLPIMSDTTFAPTSNEKCKWCDFAKGKGGPCQFGIDAVRR